MEPVTIAADVLAFMGQPASMTSQAEAVVGVITAMADDYTRGRGFVGGTPTPLVEKVIVSASARLLANPDQIEFQTGSVAIRSAFTGWTPLEKTLLNTVRRTAA